MIARAYEIHFWTMLGSHYIPPLYVFPLAYLYYTYYFTLLAIPDSFNDSSVPCPHMHINTSDEEYYLINCRHAVLNVLLYILLRLVFM